MRAGGMPYYMINTNMQYVTSSSFLLTTYAKYLSAARRTVNCGGRQVTAATLISAAQSQVYLGASASNSFQLLIISQATFHVECSIDKKH